jgi:hypothetical protein
MSKLCDKCLISDCYQQYDSKIKPYIKVCNTSKNIILKEMFDRYPFELNRRYIITPHNDKYEFHVVKNVYSSGMRTIYIVQVHLHTSKIHKRGLYGHSKRIVKLTMRK